MSQQVGTLNATAFTEFEFISSIQLTPSLCSHVFIEFMKQILYAKGQIPTLYNKLIPTNNKPTKMKKKVNSKDLKLNRLFETMNECQQSIHKIFKNHYQINYLNTSENNITFIDILLLFGKSYLSPLETYSLRFYINGNDNNNNDNNENKSEINDKNMKKIKAVIAKNLNQIDKIWDSNLPLTDCKICVNANIKQDLTDTNFIWKHDLYLRLQSKKQRKNKNKNNIYIMNFWNKNIAKIVTEKVVNDNSNKHKENDIPFYFIHNINELVKGNNNSDNDIHINDNKEWFLSNFKFSGIV